MSLPLWQPGSAQIEAANLTAFCRQVEKRYQLHLPDYDTLWEWSVTHTEEFWCEVWDFCGIIAETRGDPVLCDGDQMPGAQFFPKARLNFAENLLRRRDNTPAILFRAEDQHESSMTHAELYTLTSRLAEALRAEGIQPGDRVVGFVPNMPQTLAVCLAALSLGAVWASCSPDFGVAGVLDRFGQIEPKILFCADGYYYNGKAHDSLIRVAECAANLPSIIKIIVFPFITQEPDLLHIPRAVSLPDFIAPFAGGEISFVRLPFNHPLFIMFSSGTTGKPKCIIHGAGGTLLQQIKEHKLNADIKPGDRLFFFTTCGWMMWNWLITALASEAILILYDGSPFYPDGTILFDFADQAGITHFGTSAKWIDSCRKAELKPAKTHDLTTIRTIFSTGSPLVPESFNYIYDHVKDNVALASISGGTDIMSCFMLGNPIGPIWCGEIQARGLGMAVDVFDSDGNPVHGEKGELVCTRPFPSMPLGFWNDPDQSRYHAAYFQRFPNIWCHGDFVALTEHNGLIVYGRSDALLNPGGVRIGTAEIYRQVEQMDEILEAVAIGQNWANDVRVVLFVRLAQDVALDDNLITRIKKQIRDNTTPRHVPAKIIAIADIPRTKSGKIAELACRDIVHNRALDNIEALANPEALELFRGISELQTD